MADDYSDERVKRSEGTERVLRREDRRRQLRRQRLFAAAALLVVGAALLAVVTSLVGGGSDDSSRKTASSPSQNHGTQAEEPGNGSSNPVRNATPQPDWKPYTGPVPILEYHVLGQPQTEVPYPDLYVPRAGFRKQMDWLDQQGYEAVTLEAVEEAWYHGGTLPAKPIVISFDD